MVRTATGVVEVHAVLALVDLLPALPARTMRGAPCSAQRALSYGAPWDQRQLRVISTASHSGGRFGSGGRREVTSGSGAAEASWIACSRCGSFGRAGGGG